MAIRVADVCYKGTAYNIYLFIYSLGNSGPSGPVGPRGPDGLGAVGKNLPFHLNKVRFHPYTRLSK